MHYLFFYIFTSFLPTAYLFKKNYDPPHFFNKLSISLFPVDPKQFSFQVSFKKLALQHYLYQEPRCINLMKKMR